MLKQVSVAPTACEVTFDMETVWEFRKQRLRRCEEHQSGRVHKAGEHAGVGRYDIQHYGNTHCGMHAVRGSEGDNAVVDSRCRRPEGLAAIVMAGIRTVRPCWWRWTD